MNIRNLIHRIDVLENNCKKLNEKIEKLQQLARGLKIDINTCSDENSAIYNDTMLSYIKGRGDKAQDIYDQINNIINN